MITRERAKEIVLQCQTLAQEYGGPWCDQMDKVVTPEEDRYIRLHWSAMPSYISYVDSFNDFLYERICELG